MTDEQFKYWNKKTAESKCNWFDLYHENDIQSEINNGVKLEPCVNTDNLTDNILKWEELFKKTTSEVSNNPEDANKTLNNYWKSIMNHDNDMTKLNWLLWIIGIGIFILMIYTV